MTEVNIDHEISNDCSEFEYNYRCCRSDDRKKYTNEILQDINLLTEQITELKNILNDKNINILNFEQLIKIRYYTHVIKEIAYFTEQRTLRLERELIEFEKYERFTI